MSTKHGLSLTGPAKHMTQATEGRKTTDFNQIYSTRGFSKVCNNSLTMNIIRSNLSRSASMEGEHPWAYDSLNYKNSTTLDPSHSITFHIYLPNGYGTISCRHLLEHILLKNRLLVQTIKRSCLCKTLVSGQTTGPKIQFSQIAGPCWGIMSWKLHPLVYAGLLFIFLTTIN